MSIEDGIVDEVIAARFGIWAADRRISPACPVCAATDRNLPRHHHSADCGVPAGTPLRMILAAAVLTLVPPVLAQGLTYDDPPLVRMLISLAEISGQLEGCYHPSPSAELPRLIDAVAGYYRPGFWAWLVGDRAEYRHALDIRTMLTYRTAALSCVIDPLSSGYIMLTNQIVAELDRDTASGK